MKKTLLILALLTLGAKCGGPTEIEVVKVKPDGCGFMADGDEVDGLVSEDGKCFDVEGRLTHRITMDTCYRLIEDEGEFEDAIPCKEVRDDRSDQ